MVSTSAGMTKMRRTIIFAESDIGEEFCCWLIEHRRADIACIVCGAEGKINDLAVRNGVLSHIFVDDRTYLEFLNLNDIQPTLGLLVWWPKIISNKIIQSASGGFVNTHPSFLPYCRGKHYSFWTIVERAPFGVTLHRVSELIDDGPILAQRKISYDWEDTGQTLQQKAKEEMLELLKDSYENLHCEGTLNIDRVSVLGSYHHSSEIKAASHLDLDDLVSLRDLLNLLRAKTHSIHKPCTFTEKGITYEVRVSITREKK